MIQPHHFTVPWVLTNDTFWAILEPSGIKSEGGVIYSILIIEGEPTLRRELTSALADAVLKVAHISADFEMLRKLNEFKPDLVIMDEELPLLDGWEACYWLHQTFGIPVILLGRDSSGEAWARAVQVGADFYLRLPFSGLELAARVKAILSRYKKDQLTPPV